MNHGVLMNKNTFVAVVSNETVKMTIGATIAAITKVESSLDDFSLHSHDEEEIIKLCCSGFKSKNNSCFKGGRIQ
jgi:hypothetical protein